MFILMIDLLYLSHTAIPSHLEELEGLDLLGPGEQVLVALDGVLLDGNGRRISGPTLHDYCLLTSMRVLLWARDYGRHLCYAFPLTELCLVEGVGLDPLHAHLHLAFAASGEEEQRFTLTLLPLADLPAAVTLLRLAADAAQSLAAQGVEPTDAAADIVVLVSEQMYGGVDEETPADMPYRWPGGEPKGNQKTAPTLQQDPTSLPPEQFYSVSRVGRAAWDTVNRALRDTELPFNLNGSDVRNVAEALRALNDLLTTVAGNPGAREVVMAFLRRRGGGDTDASSASPRAESQSQPASSSSRAEEGRGTEHPYAASVENAEYREIPLRRRGEPTNRPVLQPAPLNSDRGDTIPLRRRGGERRS